MERSNSTRSMRHADASAVVFPFRLRPWHWLASAAVLASVAAGGLVIGSRLRSATPPALEETRVEITTPATATRRRSPCRPTAGRSRSWQTTTAGRGCSSATSECCLGAAAGGHRRRLVPVLVAQWPLDRVSSPTTARSSASTSTAEAFRSSPMLRCLAAVRGTRMTSSSTFRRPDLSTGCLRRAASRRR